MIGVDEYSDRIAALRIRKLSRGAPDPSLESKRYHARACSDRPFFHRTAGGAVKSLDDVGFRDVPSLNIVEAAVVAFGDNRVKVSSVIPIPGYCPIIQVITPLATRGTFNVLVSAIGYSKNPASLTQASPVISPVPFRTNDPAGTFLCQTSSRGMTTVTPVRTGPTPGFNGPSPEIRVVCPTLTPTTSVIALRGPVA